MKLIVTFLGTALALWIADWLVDGIEFTGEWWQFLIVTALVGGANMFIRPIAKAISLPLRIITLGLFTIVVNALLLQLVFWLSEPDRLDLGFTSDGFFWSTVFASIIVSVTGGVLGLVLPDGGGMSKTT